MTSPSHGVSLSIRVGAEHPGTLETFRVVARILGRQAMDSSRGSSLSVSEAGDVEPVEDHDEEDRAVRETLDRSAGAVAR